MSASNETQSSCEHNWIGGPEWDALHCSKCPATKRNERREGNTALTADNLAAFIAGETPSPRVFEPSPLRK